MPKSSHAERLRSLLRRALPPIITFFLTIAAARRAHLRTSLVLLSSTTVAAATVALTNRPPPTMAPSLDWLDAIQAVAKIIDAFSEGLSGPSINIFVDASLQRLLHADHAKSNKGAAKACPPTGKPLLEKARSYLDFAIAPYGFLLLKLTGVIEPEYNILLEGARGIDVVKYMLRLDDEHVLLHDLDGEQIGVPRYFVAVHHPTSSIVVSIRGTNSVSDVITDLLCGNATFHKGYAHSGMLSSAEQIVSGAVDTIKKAATETGYGVVVTGHSLGAGVSVILTKMLLLHGIRTVCFAFAPPPVVGPQSAIDSEWREAVRVFVHDDDLVARLCFASAKHLVREMDVLGAVGDGEVKRELIDSGDVHRVREVAKATGPVECASGFEHLFLPTRIVHWLLPCDGDLQVGSDELPPAYVPGRKYECVEAPPVLFEKVLVTSECVSAHMINSYTGALAGLGLPKREKLDPPVRADFGKPWYANELG